MKGFSGCDFRASITKMEYTPQGEAKLLLLVPYRDRMKVQPLMDAFGIEMQVSMDRKGRK